MTAQDIEDEKSAAQRAIGVCPECKTNPVIRYEPGSTTAECQCEVLCNETKKPILKQWVRLPDWQPHEAKEAFNKKIEPKLGRNLSQIVKTYANNAG